MEGLSSDEIGRTTAAAGLTLRELAPQGASVERGLHGADRELAGLSLAVAGGSMNSTAPVEPTTAPAHARVQAQPVTFGRVVRSEWIKFWTLRSTMGVLGAAVVGMIVIALIVALNTRRISSSVQPEDLVPSATMQGYFLGQLLIGALGVLFVTGEYSTAMIRSTMGAVPKRLPVLWAITTRRTPGSDSANPVR